MSNPAALAEGERSSSSTTTPACAACSNVSSTSRATRVRAVENTEQMDRLLSRELFQLVVLDLMLPGEDGLTACRRLREQNNQVPIIMLTAKGDEGSRIQGLELGADDYLAKPFNPRELLARIKAVLRRQAPLVPGAPAGADEVVTFGDYQLFLATRELKKGDEVHMLTTGEFAVLKALVQHAREPLTRGQADEPRPWPRVGCPGAFHRRADLAPAPADRAGSVQAALYPDGLGRRLRVRAGRQRAQGLSLRAAGAAMHRPRRLTRNRRRPRPPARNRSDR